MRRCVGVAVIILILLCMLILVPSGTAVAKGSVVELPLDAKAGLPLLEEGFLSDRSYEDPSISITISTGRIYDTNYVAARVKLANASQIRTAFSQSYTSVLTQMGTTMSKRVNAALAINGDYYGAKNNVGYVARQGRVYRNYPDGIHDVLLIDDKGDLHIIETADRSEISAFEGKIVNGFTFGPALVKGGVRQTGFKNNGNAALVPAQRMCLAQTGPLEYLCVCSEGPEDKGSVGLTIEQFARLVASMGDVKEAYNLDGGSSTTMVFGHEKINSPNNPKRRPLYDIIYFCSAYQAD